ncbi:MAG: alpha-amylase family glycosyl hydrolase [Flavobacteriaceae bacterium]|nr:alpha-amylase family glycosyl hydrolase [Flavobacteriaceae bacterium]
MKNIFITLVLLILIGCHNPSAPIVNEMSPVTEADLASGVLYEANIRQYSPEGTFNAFAKDLPKLSKLGVKFLWLMPINPISTTKSKGPLGSYYAVSDYTGVNPEFGTLEDLKSLVDQAHKLGIYVMLDWVPGHTGWDNHWIKDHPDYYLQNDAGEIIDPINPFTGKSFGWTDVADLNYENMEMRQAMRDAMVYWVKEVNIDGYRVDQAYAVPMEFYKKTFAALREVKPVFLLAETDINHPGGIEMVDLFDASYDWPGHHLLKDIVHGKKNVSDWDTHIENLFKNYNDRNILVNFISNHDENSWNGTVEESFGKASDAALALDYMSPGMPLIYSGMEYNLNKRLLFFEKDSFPKVAGKTFKFLEKLGALKQKHAALNSGENRGLYTRIATSRDQNVLAFERSKQGDTVVFIANMSNEYVGFTSPYNGTFKRYQDGKEKVLSDTYEYRMNPWEFWILSK